MATAVNDTDPRCGRRHYVLHRNDEATNLARISIREFLASTGREDLVDIGEICISELVGNCIRHTTSSVIVVQMWPNDGSPLFEVWDDCLRLPEFPATVSFDDLEAESGRGLLLVKHLAQACGTTRLPPAGEGKVVWFRL